MFTWVDVCSTQPLCRGIESAFRRVTHQRPRRRRRRRVYFGPYRNNPDNNGVDQIVTLPSPPSPPARHLFTIVRSGGLTLTEGEGNGRGREKVNGV